MKCPVECCLTHVAAGPLCTRHREMAASIKPDYFNGSDWQVTIWRIEEEERKR